MIFMPVKRSKRAQHGRKNRPMGVTILAVLEIIGALFMFLGSAFFGAIGSLGLVSVLLGAVFGFGALALLVAGLISLLTAYGFLKGEGWGWWLGMIVAGLSILSIALLNILGFVLGLIIAYYLTRPNVKRWFDVRV